MTEVGGGVGFLSNTKNTNGRLDRIYKTQTAHFDSHRCSSPENLLPQGEREKWVATGQVRFRPVHLPSSNPHPPGRVDSHLSTLRAHRRPLIHLAEGNGESTGGWAGGGQNPLDAVNAAG